MTISEFSNGFDLYYNNITSNQAPGLNEWEKSMFLTKAEKEVTLNHFTANSKGNNIGQGFDDSAKRQADFSVLMKTGKCGLLGSFGKDVFSYTFTFGDTVRTLYNVTFEDNTTLEPVDVPEGTYTALYQGGYLMTMVKGTLVRIVGNNVPTVNCTMKVEFICSRIDPRSGTYSFPEDTFIIINEALYTKDKKILQVIPLRYDEYTRLMSKPFKRPNKNQAWRLMNSGEVTNGSVSNKYVEIIVNAWDEDNLDLYNVRYIRVPKPLILVPSDDLSIDGYLGKDVNGNYVKVGDSTAVTQGIDCELDPILHEEILQRAVELAKIAWTSTGQDNAQMVLQAGQRSE